MIRMIALVAAAGVAAPIALRARAESRRAPGSVAADPGVAETPWWIGHTHWDAAAGGVDVSRAAR